MVPHVRGQGRQRRCRRRAAALLDSFEDTYGVPLFRERRAMLGLGSLSLSVDDRSIRIASMQVCIQHATNNDSKRRGGDAVPIVDLVVIVVGVLSLLFIVLGAAWTTRAPVIIVVVRPAVVDIAASSSSGESLHPRRLAAAVSQACLHVALTEWSDAAAVSACKS